MTFVEIMQNNAIIAILGISVLLSLATTLVYKYMTDQALIKQVRDDIKKYQKEMKESKSDPAKMMELSKKTSALSMKIMPQQFKPMLITIIPFIVIFWWLGKIFTGMTVIPFNFHFPLSSMETGLGWIGVYIIFSMIFTTAIRKALKVY